MDRKNIGSGKPWETLVGYSRAVRVGNHIHVAGTVAAGANGEGLFPGDAGGQTTQILATIEKALKELGADLRHVVRTRIFVTDITQWESIGTAHGRAFAQIRPVTTMVEVQKLIGPEFLVEIEAEAIVHVDSLT